MSSPIRNFQWRGSTMAVMCVVAVGGALGGMYLINRNVKRNEGETSPYKEGGGGLSGGSDMNMTSADVARSVSIPKPGKERTTTTQK